MFAGDWTNQTLIGIASRNLQAGVWFAFVIAVAAAGVAVRRAWARCAPGVRRSKLPTLGPVIALGTLGCLLTCGYLAGGWTLRSVGISNSVAPPVALATGCGEYFLFAMAWGALVTASGTRVAYTRATMRANARLLGSSPFRNRFVIALLVLANPVLEELLFRGILVHQLTLIGAPLGLALALGAVLNGINHAYQGRLLQFYHFAFYGSTVALLFSPVGLLGAIGMHYMADLLPFVRFPAQLRGYRALRRQIRRANHDLRVRAPTGGGSPR